jgi:DNA-binding XRE family transcriptional regulator
MVFSRLAGDEKPPEDEPIRRGAESSAGRGRRPPSKDSPGSDPARAGGPGHDAGAARGKGRHSTTVGKIERGKQIPSIALLTVLAGALDVTVSELLRFALPETTASADSVKEEATVMFVKALPKPERRRLLQLLEALQKWKGVDRP